MSAQASPYATASSWLNDYWSQSRRPLASLAFVIPLLTLYEAGVLLLGSGNVRNGADVWLRTLLDKLGFSHYFLLPALTICILLAWHHATGDRWQLSAGVLYAMAVECVLLALLLLGIARLQVDLLNSAAPVGAVPLQQLGAPRFSILNRIVGFCGAGIYEEVLFRLMLLPPLFGLLTAIGVSRPWRIVSGVVATSAVFAAAHHIGSQGEPFAWFPFVFRFIAGAVFALLFVYRGFGIAAGTHALYDIAAGL